MALWSNLSKQLCLKIAHIESLQADVIKHQQKTLLLLSHFVILQMQDAFRTNLDIVFFFKPKQNTIISKYKHVFEPLFSWKMYIFEHGRCISSMLCYET